VEPSSARSSPISVTPFAGNPAPKVKQMHNINEMVYVGTEPWHGLGVELPKNATYEEISVLAGFYDAQERPLYVPESTDPVPDRKALVRGDDGRYLAVVGTGYKVVQFSDVAKTLVEAAGIYGGFFHTAGTLGPVGRRGWLLGELPGEIVVKGDPSPVRKYLLGCTAHDGMSAVTLMNVATRVVCANTLGVALGERGGATFKVVHSANAGARLEEAASAIKRLLISYDRFGEVANALAVTRFTSKQLVNAMDQVFPLPSDGHRHDGIIRDREKIEELFEAGVGIESTIRGTGWAAFQAFTEFADHHRQVRTRQGQDARHQRLESIWMGRAAQLKQIALTAIASESGIRMAA
jgi:phage/plasmid-like protein (TIGR03299 family)